MPKGTDLIVRATVAVVALLVSVYVLRSRFALCDMSRDLAPLMTGINRVFARHNISLILEGGTLIGAARERAILSHELDIDLAIMHTDYDKAISLKEELTRETGYKLYGVDDYIFAKAWHRAYTFTWEPYLDVPCLRVYDDHDWFYADIFCYTVVTEKHIPVLQKAAAHGHFRPPADVNAEAFVLPKDGRTLYLDSWLVPSYVLWDKDLLPLQEFPFYGQTFYVPHNYLQVLDQLYTSSWRNPQMKGVRKVFCNPTLHLLLCVIVLALSLRFAWLPLVNILRARSFKLGS
eukprot:m.177235 g.177235  ORF g.177235 m.177235 type:complete len:290 (+) comp17376_c0_seq1:2012-2881(+)